jgi:RNA-directed DNA polymerase
MEDGLVSPVDEGTPQGGPLSPILSNLVLDDLDKELARRGHRFCRYADDCNIYVRSRRAGERVMASVSRFLTNKLWIKVNEAKSAVAWPEERKFLGFSISNDGSERRIAPKALDKFKGRIRDMTRRTLGLGLQQLIKELKPYIVDGAATSASARLRESSRTSKRGSVEDCVCIFGGSGEPGKTASKNYAIMAYRSSMQR